MPVRELPPGRSIWDRLGDPDHDPTLPRKPPMKTTISATFEGTPAQFMKWVEDNFKNPEALKVTASLTVVDPEAEARAEQQARTQSDMDQLLAFARNYASPQRVSDAQFTRAFEGSFPFAVAGNKIQAIKHIRIETEIGLKEAKDLVESEPYRRLTARLVARGV